MADKLSLVFMVRGNETLRVHPTTVEAHKAAGFHEVEGTEIVQDPPKAAAVKKDAAGKTEGCEKTEGGEASAGSANGEGGEAATGKTE